MNFQTIPDKLAGDAFTQSMWASYIEANGNLGYMRLLAPPIVVSTPVALIDFSAIPATFEELMIVHSLCCDTGAAFVGINMRINNDATNGAYLSQVSYSSGATNTAAEQITGTSALVGYMGVTSAAAGRILIPTYQEAHTRGWTCESYGAFGSLTGQQRRLHGGGSHLASGPVNEVTLLAASGNFNGGTVALYGLPA